jgi:hypothetical protein
VPLSVASETDLFYLAQSSLSENAFSRI